MLRDGTVREGPVADCSRSDAPVAVVALLLHAKTKPPVVVHVLSATTTTAEMVTSEDRGVEAPVKLGVKATRKAHGAQLRPSPAVPGGQAPQLVALAQATPEKQNHAAPQPAGGDGGGGLGDGEGGSGGAESTATTGAVVNTTPDTGMPALCNDAALGPPVDMIRADRPVAIVWLRT